MVPCSHTAWAASRSAGFWQTCNTQESSDTQGEFHISVLSPQPEEAGTWTQRGHVFSSTYNMLHVWRECKGFPGIQTSQGGLLVSPYSGYFPIFTKPLNAANDDPES